MKNKFFAMFDYLLLLAIFILIGMGVMFIYSSSINSEGISVTNEYSDFADEKSFVSVLITDGNGTIDDIEIKKGDSLFIPANYGEFKICGNIEGIITRV